jgi:hypothetical protein
MDLNMQRHIQDFTLKILTWPNFRSMNNEHGAFEMLQEVIRHRRKIKLKVSD